MSGAEDGGPGRREVAYRLFAAEFDDADFSYSESDEERAPNYVVTPTGARVNRLFVVGVLTEVEPVNEEVLRARVVDPTGPFVVYAGQYQPDELAFLEDADPPTFVAVTGKARTFQPEDSEQVYTSIRPESISEVDADTRDRWVVGTAERTMDRVARMAEAKETGLSGGDLRSALTDRGVDEGLAAGIPLALDHYGTTGDYLSAVREMALDAARVVAGRRDEIEALTVAPDQGGDDRLAALIEESIDAEQPDEETVETGSAQPASAPTQSESGTDESDVAGETTETTAGREDDTEPATAGNAETTTTDDTEPAAADDTEPATTDDTEPATTDETDEDLGDFDASGGDSPESDVSEPAAGAGEQAAEGDEDLEDFEPEFELDEEEREEIESEYGTEFQSGTEVDEPGEADIDTPDPEEIEADSEDETSTESADTSSEPVAENDRTDAEDVDTEPESADEADATAGEDSADLEDVDLEDAVMDAMEELDDGDGADREELIATVVERYGTDPGDAEDAIQDALMDGRCYEPDDATLKPI